MTKVKEPHHVEAEQAFLGSIIVEPPTLSRATRLVRPADFFIERHTVIFQAMQTLDRAGLPLDRVTLADELGSQLEGVGGFLYLIELEQRVPTALNLDTYASIIRKYARLRRLLHGAGRIARLAHTATRQPDEALALAEAVLLRLVKEDRLNSVRPIGDIARRYLNRVKDRPAALGLSTGLAALDALCGRLQPADLVLLTGEPGTLKTALALTIARSVSLTGRKTALFSLESSNEQVVQRLLSVETGLPAQRLRLGDIGDDWPALEAAGARLADWNLYVDDTPGLQTGELRSKARWLNYLWQLDLIIVNYLQLLRPDEQQGSREQDLAAIGRALKALARELKLPLLAVSLLDPKNPVQAESDVIWLCERQTDHLVITQTRWRDGPAGTSIELNLGELCTNQLL